MKAIVKEIEIAAPSSRVWHELTQPDRMRLWMSQKPMEIETNWRIGENFVIKSDFNGKYYSSRGRLLRFETERDFSYSYWIAISRLPDEPQNYAVIRYELLQLSQGTQLTLSHQNLAGEEAYPHANFYWNSALYLLKQQAEGLNVSLV